MENLDGNRDGQGRFIKGNKAGRGRPIGSRVDSLRRALLEAVSADDIIEIIRALIVRARGGDVGAAKMVLSYVLGNPTAFDIIERQGLQTIEQVEKQDRNRQEFEDRFDGLF